ncbi:hypothetical protein NECAME_00938 [Necator americanus]|uniref:Uncharacterized protein n=1 Tax=Necator americanus TaxID=51031 RepID=W2SNJ5_NECAM|nr:hypothetical protein NECAME_00938 [Necator americanus]ETN71249.1 hypothetical protein NECAME_00938 [Necator americanus]
MSVKRKSSRVNTGMKLVGIKTVDDQFKTAVAPLCESIAMRNKLEAALFPVIIVTGQIPDQLQRTFQKLKTLISHCVATLGHADNLLTKIEESIKHISESHDELAHLCLESGLKGQKATRAAENFTWNLRLLKAQLGLVAKSQDEAQDIITQVFDVGGVLGILSPKLTQRSGRRFSRVIHDPLKDSSL